MQYESRFPEDARRAVDLRSDTVTRPTPAMYEAMINAPLGDDVLGDEPTVTRLEELAAEMLGKEAAVFVPSGTMGNQIALAVHCRPGDAILIEEEAHILYYEVGAPAVVAGVVSWTIPSRRGVMGPDDIEKRILKRTIHTPGTALLCLENTHNRSGGTIVPLDTMAGYKELADRHGVKVHLDGARVFNAAVALGVPVREIAQHADTVNFCLSKGLGAPVGSLLAGPAPFIEEARVWRKRLGGGMRQAGILAACGIVSLTEMVQRLEEDHQRARTLASGIAELPGVQVDWDTVQTNMVVAQVAGSATDWLETLKANDVWALAVAPDRIRLVTHADIDDEKVGRAIDAFALASQTMAVNA
jgi:threonine aldolase